MDKQQGQKNQNPNQEVEYISVFLDEDVEVNESDFDESAVEQEKAGKLADSQQNKAEEEKQTKRPKRPRKTIEQEIAELDAKRERLMEKKRRQEAHEKIVFGTTVIAMLKDMKYESDNEYNSFCDRIINFTKMKQSKNQIIIIKILNCIKGDL